MASGAGGGGPQGSTLLLGGPGIHRQLWAEVSGLQRFPEQTDLSLNSDILPAGEFGRGLRFADLPGEFPKVTWRRTPSDSLRVKEKKQEASCHSFLHSILSSKILPDWVYATASSEQRAASSES